MSNHKTNPNRQGQLEPRNVRALVFDDTSRGVAFQAITSIMISAQLLTATMERAFPQGITIAQFGLLNHFVRLGTPETPTRLASDMQVTKSTMTSTLARMSEKNLVFERRSQADKRSKEVFVTADGRRLHAACLKALAPAVRQLLSTLPSDLLPDLAVRLEVLKRALEQLR